MQRDLNVLVERQVGLVRKLGSETIEDEAIEDRDDKTPGSPNGEEGRRIPHHQRHFQQPHAVQRPEVRTQGVAQRRQCDGTADGAFVGGYLVIKGQTTIGTVVAFVSGFERLSGPLRDLLNFYREYEQAKVQYRMIVQWTEGNQANEPEKPKRRSKPAKRRRQMAADS